MGMGMRDCYSRELSRGVRGTRMKWRTLRSGHGVGASKGREIRMLFYEGKETRKFWVANEGKL